MDTQKRTEEERKFRNLSDIKSCTASQVLKN